MKNIFFVLLFCIFALPVSAYSGKASKFAAQEYAKKNNCKKVCINMKREYCLEQRLNICNLKVQKIIYGWGDIKVKGCKKKRITYVVLLDNSGKPCWSNIIFYK